MVNFLLMLAGWIAADLIFWRAANNRIQKIRFGALWRIVLAVFMLVQLSYMVVIFVGSIVEHVPEFHPMIWPIAVYVWHLGVLPIAILALSLRWIGGRIICILRRRQPEQRPPPSTDSVKLTSRFSRRDALRGAAALLPPLATVAITGRAAAEINGFRIRRVELWLPTLPRDLDGVTLAHVTDLHIGRFLPSGMAERAADATNALEVDLVAFTGDLIDLSAPHVQPGIDFIRRLDRRSGLVMIEGNHDVMADADRFEGEVRAAGLPLLLDESTSFRIPGRPTPIQFLGISWGVLTSGRDLGRYGKDALRRYRVHSDAATAASLNQVLAQRKSEAFPILLAHHPHAFDPAAAAGLPLVLSGHTHGGQVMLTEHIGAGPLRFRYWSGLYRKSNSQMFVSNGIGNWFPLRINAPAEIVHLTLRCGGGGLPPAAVSASDVGPWMRG